MDKYNEVKIRALNATTSELFSTKNDEERQRFIKSTDVWQNNLNTIQDVEYDLENATTTGQQILTEMNRQRRIIDSIHDRLANVQDNISNGGRILSQMKFKLIQHKLLLLIIIIILIFIFLLIIVIKFFWNDFF